jgi:hypothetical protein
MERKMTEHYEPNYSDIRNVMLFLVTAEKHNIILSGINATEALISACELVRMDVRKVREVLIV